MIGEYIKKKATAQSKSRGKALFDQGKVIDFSIEEAKSSAKCRVIGTGIYSVQIHNYDTGKLSSSCSCPYDWGGICKHQVSALLSLEEFLIGNESNISIVNKHKAPKTVLRKSNLSYSFPFQTLSSEFIDEHSTKWNDNYAELELYSVTPEEILVKYHGHYSFESLNTTFWFKSNQIYSRCSCAKSVVKLCGHQTKALYFILRDLEAPNLLSLLKPNDHSFYKGMYENLGISMDEKWEEVFHISSEDSELYVTTKDKYKGLMAKSIYEKEDFMSYIGLDRSRDISIKSHLPMISHTKGQPYKIGYLFSCSTYVSGDTEFDVFSGKLNKDGLAITTHLQTYDHLSFKRKGGVIEDYDEEILTLADRINYNEEAVYNPYANSFDPDNEDSIALQKRTLELLSQLFQVLPASPYIYFSKNYDNYSIRSKDLTPIKVSPEKISLSFEVVEDDEFISLIPKVKVANKAYKIHSNTIFRVGFLTLKIKDTLYLFPSLAMAYDFDRLIEAGALKVTSAGKEAFYTNFVEKIANNYEVKIKNNTMSKTKSKVKTGIVTSSQLYIKEFNNFILFTPAMSYDGEHTIDTLSNATLLKNQNGQMITIPRDDQKEQDHNALIRSLHPKFAKQGYQDFFNLSSTELLEQQWFLHAFETLRQHNIEVFGWNELKSINYYPHAPRVTLGLKSGEDWFEANVSMAFGDQEISIQELMATIVNKEKYVTLDNGKKGIIPEEWLKKLERFFVYGTIKDERIQIPKIKFNIIDEMFDNLDNEEIMEEIFVKKERLKSLDKLNVVKPHKKIKATLRDYQQEGLNWMCFLDEYRWGGILADDMGLGKTLQVIAFIRHIKGQQKNASLIIVPTSLLFNWEKEIEKFCPDINAYFHYGQSRKADTTEFDNYDLIITSYGTLTSDIKTLAKYKFNYLILDESQAIKNPSSQRYKAVCLLKGNNRIAMTGTPVENSLLDLYAQMNFLNPGFLGSVSHFKKMFALPIEKDKSKDRMDALNKLTSPFILRRTKEKVAKELPPKTEEIIYCEMDNAQRKVYDAYRNRYRKKLLKQIDEEGLGKSKIHVLEGLTKLRQICNSPALLPDEKIVTTQSIKIKELIRHITDKTGNHKILVFSQFVKMLKLIEEQLENENITFEYLDGSSTTSQRQQSVENFQENEQIRVFLISLKAGGSGLNLTAADYVYLVDPWWNPAVENQAIDRCYRIGQDKKVIAYRMICKDTLEEKIVNLQEGKKNLAENSILADESFMKKLDRNSISDIFG